MTILAKSIRDNYGVEHRRGEVLIILGPTIEIGTHRTLLKAEVAETHQRMVVFPDEIEEIEE